MAKTTPQKLFDFLKTKINPYKCWTIDAWRTPDDDEEGVAPIEVYLDGSLKIRDGKAFYTAILDFGIIQAVEEVLNEIQSENKG